MIFQLRVKRKFVKKMSIKASIGISRKAVMQSLLVYVCMGFLVESSFVSFVLQKSFIFSVHSTINLLCKKLSFHFSKIQQFKEQIAKHEK